MSQHWLVPCVSHPTRSTRATRSSVRLRTLHLPARGCQSRNLKPHRQSNICAASKTYESSLKTSSSYLSLISPSSFQKWRHNPLQSTNLDRPPLSHYFSAIFIVVSLRGSELSKLHTKVMCSAYLPRGCPWYICGAYRAVAATTISIDSAIYENASLKHHYTSGLTWRSGLFVLWLDWVMWRFWSSDGGNSMKIILNKYRNYCWRGKVYPFKVFWVWV